LASAEAQVSQAEAQLAALRDRPTDGELAAAEAQVAQAEAQLIAQTDGPRAEDIAVSEAQVEESKVALDQVLSQVTDAVLAAPFEGRLLSVDIREGEWANPGVPAVSLAAVEPLVLSVFIDEVDVAQIREGQPAHLTFDAIKDEEVVGTVTYIAPASTNVGGAVAYALEVSFDPGELPVRLGMTADVDIVTSSVDDTILVPNRAIEADRVAGRYFVTVLNPDGTTERIEVQIGLRDEDYTEVLDKLEEGAQVVVPEIPDQIEGPGGPFGGGGMGGGMGGN
jgi:HlyD family secretion protein